MYPEFFFFISKKSLKVDKVSEISGYYGTYPNPVLKPSEFIYLKIVFLFVSEGEKGEIEEQRRIPGGRHFFVLFL